MVLLYVRMYHVYDVLYDMSMNEEMLTAVNSCSSLVEKNVAG